MQAGEVIIKMFVSFFGSTIVIIQRGLRRAKPYQKDPTGRLIISCHHQGYSIILNKLYQPVVPLGPLHLSRPGIFRFVINTNVMLFLLFRIDAASQSTR